MTEPKMPGFQEKYERPVKFVVMPGALGRTPDRDDGMPVAYFVRPEGSRDSHIESQDEDSIATYITELYSKEALDFFTGIKRTSEQMRVAAEEFAKRMSDPAFQKNIREIMDRKRKLAEAIRKSELEIEKQVKDLGEKMGLEYYGPRKTWQLRGED